MVSATQQTSRIRARKARKAGTVTKREARAHGTAPFPIHPEGYDPKAADAKPSIKAEPVKAESNKTAAKADAKTPPAAKSAKTK